MTVATRTVSATLHAGAGTYPLDVREGSVTLDEGWAPYGKADLTIALPSSDVLDLLDPRDSARITLYAESHPVGLASSSRSWDLALRERTIDHNAATVRLAVATDEALLQDAANNTSSVNTSYLRYQSSLRTLISNLLTDRLGKTLQAGTADADFTTLTSLTNSVKNPSGEVDASNWFGSTTSTVARSTAKAWRGAASIAATVSGAAPAWSPTASATDRFPVTPGNPYTFSVYILSSVARPAFNCIRFYDSTGVQIGADNVSVTANTSTTAWTRYTVTATAPAGAVTAWVYIRTTSDASGTVHYCDGAMFTQTNGYETDGVTPLAYFDGTTADTSLYNYDWTGTANASTSTRTPVFQRDPQTLAWEPGESAYDFIQPVLQQANLRLFCDELRRWYLVDSTFSVAGRVTIAQSFNVYEASDTISRDAKAADGTPLWFDAVVLKYTWTDTTNTQQVRYDTASVVSPTQTALFEFERPYPGPGAAAYILQRVNGQGRTLDLTARIDYAATPGMEAVATLPFTPDQTGYTSSVVWDFTADTMKVGTRGLIDTPANSWLHLGVGQKWTDSPAGASWLAEAI